LLIEASPPCQFALRERQVGPRSLRSFKPALLIDEVTERLFIVPSHFNNQQSTIINRKFGSGFQKLLV